MHTLFAAGMHIFNCGYFIYRARAIQEGFYRQPIISIKSKNCSMRLGDQLILMSIQILVRIGVNKNLFAKN